MVSLVNRVISPQAFVMEILDPGDITLRFPDLFSEPQITDPGDDPHGIHHLLGQDEEAHVGLVGQWGDALALSGWFKKHPEGSVLARKKLRRLLVPLRRGKVKLGGAPHIGWLGEEWMAVDEAWLPLPDLLGLNGSWQWQLRGFAVPGLRIRLHPLHGVYFPTRTEHVSLFQKYWKSLPDGRSRVLEIGGGSGVLTASMLALSRAEITVTDVDPNAAAGLAMERQRHRWDARLRVHLCDLDEGLPGAAFDRVVFNPPWLPGDPAAGLEHATRRSADLLPRFFAAAARVLVTGGRVVVIYSNLAAKLGLEKVHPIEEELREGGRFRLIGKREANGYREGERVELWELGGISEGTSKGA